jgi:hypothetical protein
MLFTGVMIGLLLNVSKHSIDNEKRFYIG